MTIERKSRYRYFIIGLTFLMLILIGGGFYFTYSCRLAKKQEPKYVSLNPGNDRKIYWTDKALENKIRQLINKKEGDIYLSDLWPYHTLELGRQIKYVDSENTQIVGELITNISNLEGLVNLESLNLDYQGVADISIIHNLGNLQNLSLNGNPVQDFSALEFLPLLEEVDLRNTHIQDNELKHLSGLKNLTIVYLDFNDIESLESLGSNRVAFLSASQNKIKDITSLVNLDGSVLWELDLSQNQISDIKSLSKFKKLQYLLLNDNNITDIEPLRKLKNISVLRLDNNHIKILPDFSGMTSLKSLNLSDNQISTEEWKKVKLPGGIRTIYLSGNPISDLETEREYPHLKVIFN